MVSGCSERTYHNAGNKPLLELLDADAKTILDIGCGTGANAAQIRITKPNSQLYGITVSEREAIAAAPYFEKVWVCDIEESFPAGLLRFRFDAIILSHVLEHLRDPASVVAEATRFLNDGGCVLIAVPNVVNWRQRLKLIFGDFHYELDGAMDETHLRFFTFFTADKYLLLQSPSLALAYKSASGTVPLWWLRRYLLPRAWCEYIDIWGCRLWPNLFGSQVLMRANKRHATTAVANSGSRSARELSGKPNG